MPATSQLDWLSSTTAMIVLFWSRATRDLLRSFGWGIAALHRFMQRRSCHVLAARPIASPGPTLTGADMGGAPAPTQSRAILRHSLIGNTWDRGFESPLLQRCVCELSVTFRGLM